MCARLRCLASVLVLLVAFPAAGSERPLIEAVKAGNSAAVRLLLTRASNVNAAAPDGTTALHWAVRADDLATVELLLRAGADANVANRFGVTPLSLAATNGSARMIEALLEAGADANTLLPEEETLLMRAARTGKADALKVLLAHGADPNARESFLGETALMWAAAENHPAAIQVLVEHGAKVDARSAQRSEEESQRLRRLRGVVTRGGWTPLMYAARQGALGAVRALAEAGAKLDLTTIEGTTPLVLAIINVHYDVAALLLEYGGDPNIADESGMAALYATVDMHSLPWMKGRPPSKPSGNVDSVGLAVQLLARGADSNAQLVAPLLRRHQTRGDRALGEGATPFMRAAKSGDVTMMRLLLANGADPHRMQAGHTTALMMAAGLGWRAGDTDANDRGTEAEAIDAIALCLTLGLDVNAFNDNGETALHVAVDRGDEVVKYLAARGAKLDMKDKQGRTPLDRAARGSAEVRGDHARPATAALLRELMEGRDTKASPQAVSGAIP